MVVEDEIVVAENIRSTLESMGHIVTDILASGKDAIEKARETRPHLVLMDIRLRGDVDGIEAADRIRSSFDIPVIYLTAYADEDTLRRAKVTGPFGYILKPFEERELQTIIEIALCKHEMEKKLRESEEKYRFLIENQGEGIASVGPDERISFCNPVAEEIFGVPPGQLVGRSLEEFTSPEAFDFIRRQTSRRRAGRRDSYETEIIRPNGERRLLVVTVTPWFSDEGRFLGTFGIFRDDTVRRRAQEALEKANEELELANRELRNEITVRRRTEEQLTKSLEEKEVLLKEIHHRVKNNLQVVSSLLYLQSEHIKHKQSIDVFKESQDRVKSMALVHERLYKSSDLTMIHFPDYIKDLAAHLFQSYEANMDLMGLKIDVDDLSLDIDTAIPCGLIINELISNSLKHAFPAGVKGEVCIGFHVDDAGTCTLRVADNGVGFPEEIDFRETESMGLRLVITLTNQLGGEIELDNSRGTTFIITFKKP